MTDGSDPEDAVSPWQLARDPRLVSILWLSGVGVLGTQLIPPVLPAIQTDLGVSDARIGLVMAAFYLPAALLIPVVGAISDIYGRRRVAMASLAGFGLAGVAISVAPSFDVLLALRVVQGVCFAPLTPLTVAFIGDFFSGYAGTTAQGVRASTNGLVVVFVPAVGGVLAEIAWNVPFLLYAVTIPAFVFVFVYFPGSEGVGDEPVGSVGDELRAWASGLGTALGRRNLQLLILGGFVLFGVRLTMFTIAPLLGTRVIGLRVSTVGFLLSLFGVVRILLAPQAGRFVARVSRKPAFVLCMSVIGASMGLFAYATTTPGFAAAILTFAVGMSLINPTLNDAVAASASAGNRAGVVGAMQSAKTGANTIAPAAAGILLAATDFRTVFLVAAALALGYVAVLIARLEPVSA